MLNVLQLMYNWGKGGYESYAINLVKKLHNRECKFYIAYSETLPMPEIVESLGIETFHIPMKSPYDMPAARKVAKLCNKLSIDAVHTHFIRERYVAAFSRILGNKSRLIYTSHVVVPKSPALKVTNRLVSGLEHKIIAVCLAGREQMLEEGLNPRRIKVIHNGVNIEYWKEQAASTIREEFGIADDEFVITTTGRFNEEKGHLFLIESIKALNELTGKNGMQFRFLLAGDGDLLEECKKLANDLDISDKIIFTGFRTDIRNILHGSDLYVSPSRTEALSMSIIEALACGLPVVATDVGGTSEVINDENDCGMLVPYGNSTQMAASIMGLIMDEKLYRHLKANAFKTSSEKFNLDNTIKETYNLYKGQD
ncbi:MAG: glycosyltransferase family 4 protein [Bacillota bacterium]|nr:glycosyltransferase family 4 protein [Bacillota bacterium]